MTGSCELFDTTAQEFSRGAPRCSTIFFAACREYASQSVRQSEQASRERVGKSEGQDDDGNRDCAGDEQRRSDLLRIADADKMGTNQEREMSKYPQDNIEY